MVEVGEGGGEVASDVRGQSALQAGECVVCSLAAFEPQCLDPGVVPVGPLDIAHGEVYRCSLVQRTRLPDQVACVGQQAHGGLGVPQRLGVAAEDKKAPTLRIRIRPAKTPRPLRSTRESRTDRPRRGCPASTRAMPRLAEISDSRSRSPALRANRRAALNSSIASPISPKSLKTTPTAWCATAACDADGCRASTSRAAARASDGRDSARASSLSGSQVTGAVSETTGIYESYLVLQHSVETII